MTASNIIRKEKLGVVTDNFSEAIWQICSNLDKYRKIGERGRDYVKKNLSWEKFCRRMVDLFYEVMEVDG